MAAKNKPFEAFGPYLLFKKLESDSLSELWRAGRIEGQHLAATAAVRKLTGGNREALTASAQAAQPIASQLTGTSFARDQHVGVINGIPYLAYDYANGRSLRHIVDRARGGNGATANPIPLDQAIVIAEKVALSLATTGDLRDGGGQRLSHGGLIPQFIWITDDGEIRVAGQLLGNGLVASLGDTKVGGELGRYFSPEYRHSGTPSKTSEVWSLGAILFLLVTGQEPPDAATASAFVAAVRAAKTMTGTPIPDDIRVILDKSLNLDPSMRYATIADMKTALSALAHGGKYSATTFNLAFYLSNLLKKEMEAETIERDKESKVNLAPYVEAPPQAAAAAPAAALSVPTFGLPQEQPKSKAPMLIVAAIVVIALGIGGWFMFGRKEQKPQAPAQLASATPAPAPQRVISEPVLASPTTATSTAVDPAAREKAFEDAVKAKMQAEMMKLQTQFTQQLKQEQSKNAPVNATPPAPQPVAPAPVAEDRTPSAAQLDQTRRETTPAPVTTTVAQTAPAPTATQAPAPVAPTPAAAVTTVREGDIVDVTQVDSIPRALRPIKPVYPPLAARQRVEGTVIVSALISEKGDVLDVRVLRGDGRFGLDDAAVRAMRGAKFAPAIKDGKRVRTWFPQTFQFKP
ncbi:MAG TPA: TonB family protein [Thermoanaerobaculia bacterium]|nr:TonB family protein [Thermoanaerobaculia bacterium]